MDSKCLIFIGLIVAFIPALLARRNDEAISHKEKHGDCGNLTFGPCVLKNKASTCGLGKKLATPGDENCPKKQKQVHCRIPCEAQTQQTSDCKYKKPRNVKSRDISCDPVTNRHEITLKLVKGDLSTCAPTKVISKECRKRQVRAADSKERRKNGERRQKQTATTTITAVSTVAPKNPAECKYQKAKSPKVTCDPVTNTRTVVKQLKKNSPATCEPSKTITEACQTKKAKVKKGGRKNAGHKNAEHKAEMN